MHGAKPDFSTDIVLKNSRLDLNLLQNSSKLPQPGKPISSKQKINYCIVLKTKAPGTYTSFFFLNELTFEATNV